MPGKIKVKVLAGRNLPVMDRASDTTDAFVEIKFGGVTHKTDVCRKSLNPHWNSTEWYRFEVDESELQDEPLQLRLMDHDTYSANDAIGKVVLSLAPLLAREATNARAAGPAGGAVMSGWIPVFDTMHGIRGELNIIVKVELFSDFNKYKTSSCGVQFFHCPSIPPGYRATSIHGFVEELVVNDDPEYQWIDKIRTPRASNEARQVAFIKLSNQVQRLVGLKAAELGANAVVGYQQEFDLEGEAGVVARAIGTAVSITPLPTPSQPMNIPPCTQQQLKKCLDILATDEETVTDLSEYYQTHQEELAKMISILSPNAPSLLDGPDTIDDDDDKDQPSRMSIHSYTGSMSLFHDDQIHHRSLRHLSEDQTDLNKLLSRRNEVDDEDSDSSGPIQKIKKIKTNFFTKRFSKRKRDKKEKQEDQISLKSNSSDTSRISLVDIKNELKKRFKKPKIRKVFTNPDDEGVGMASILARSVIHAHTSLACIAETQDSEQSTQENMRRTSESEPNLNVSDDDKQRKLSTDKVTEIEHKGEGIKVPDIHFSSMKNMSSSEEIPERVRKISDSCPSSPMVSRTENLLKLPGDIGYFGSVSSALSGESSYTSSDEEDESSEEKSDSDERFETTASVVNSVLNHAVNPVFIAQMEKKLTSMENVQPPNSEKHVEPQIQVQLVEDKKECEIKQENTMDNVDAQENPAQKSDELQNQSISSEIKTEVKTEEIKNLQTTNVNEPSTSTQDSEKCVTKPNTHHIKLHNPFAHKKSSKSFSAPSSPVEKHSFVYRSSKRIKHQLAKLSKSSMIKSISHISLMPKKKDDSKNTSQPGSSSNVPSRVPSDTVLGSVFLSYSDLLSLDKAALQVNRGLCKSDEIGRPNVSMYIGSEPVSRTSLSGPSFPSFRDDHSQRRRSAVRPEGLVQTAMETILIEKVDTLLLPTSPEPDTKNDKQFFQDVSEKLEEHKNKEYSRAEIMNQVQSLTGTTTPRIVAMTPKRLSSDFTAHAHTAHDSRNTSPESKSVAHTVTEHDRSHQITSHDAHEKSKHKDHNLLSAIKTSLKEHHVNLDSVFSRHGKKESSPGGLVHTAMQTMLMERAQSMIPDTPEPIPIHTEPVFERGRRSRKTSENSESSGMIHSAMQTILMDKFKAVIPSTTEPIPVHIDDDDDHNSHKNQQKHADESSGLVHNAMQTILMDKVQTVLPDTNELIPVHIEEKCEKDTTPQAEELSGLTQIAIQTMLMDKVQTLQPDSAERIPIHINNNDNIKKSGATADKGLVQSAMETMLIEKVQSVLPDEDLPIYVDNNVSKLDTENLDPKSESLLESAEAIILDKVHAVGDIVHNVKTFAHNIVEKKDDSESLGKTANILSHKVKTVHSNSADPDLITDLPIEEKKQTKHNVKTPDKSEDTSSAHSLMRTVHSEKANSSVVADNLPVPTKPSETEELKSPALVESVMKTIFKGKQQEPAESKPEVEAISQTSEESSKAKKLTRQDSIHSMTEAKESSKISERSNDTITRPMLQHFHPVLSGLETIPSASDSLERSVDGETLCTNRGSVCDNSHAACAVGRSERDRERCERDRERCERDRERCERDRDRCDKDRGSPRHARHESYGGREPGPTASLNSTSTPVGIHRRSSDSDLSVTPKGGSLNTSAGNVGSGGGAILRPSMNTDNLDMLEYPFLTMAEYPPGFVVHIGGTVCARSVKLIDSGGESAARAAWWAELRTELRAHARALRCNAVIAYTDTCSICEDVCVLSASGTAAVINLDCDYNVDIDAPLNTGSNGNKTAIEEEADVCTVAHVPYSPAGGPCRAELGACGGCKKARVPAVLLATCAKPSRLMAYPKAVTLTAVAARVRRAGPGAEPGARDISDQLPFLEYELHRTLLAKLRMQGANAVFNLSTQVALGERCVVALASGVAVKLHALPPPNPPAIKATENDKEALELQRKLWETFTANKAANGYDVGIEQNTNGAAADTEKEDPPALDLCADKDACVLELDEAEDVTTARSLCVARAHVSAYTPALRAAVAPPYAFAQVSRARLTLSQQGGAWAAAERHVAKALDSATYKLRRLQPAAVAAQFQLELPEDEIQLVVSGTAIPLVDPSKEITENGNTAAQGAASSLNGAGDADDDIFTLDEEQLVKSTSQQESVLEDKTALNGTVPTAVSLTTLSHIAGVKALRRVCALRLLFVRETTAVRELGGLSGFLHTFTCEVLAIARAYTAALGGNALTSFYIRQLMLQDNAHKNQGQCLMSVGGDIVHITY